MWLRIGRTATSQTAANIIELQECSCHNRHCSGRRLQRNGTPMFVLQSLGHCWFFSAFLSLSLSLFCLSICCLKICSVMQSIRWMPNKNTSIQHCANIMELLPDIRIVFFSLILSFSPFFNFGYYVFFCSIIFLRSALLFLWFFFHVAFSIFLSFSNWT